MKLPIELKSFPDQICVVTIYKEKDALPQVTKNDNYWSEQSSKNELKTSSVPSEQSSTECIGTVSPYYGLPQVAHKTN